MPEIPVGAAIAGAGAAQAGAGLISGIAGSGAARSAAQQQEQAAIEAAQIQRAMFEEIRAQLQPFIRFGGLSMESLLNLEGMGAKGPGPLGSFLMKPFQPTMQQLAQTPGYQFALNQGEQAVKNLYASQGLGAGPEGPSGAAAKGAINYAEGLASTTYQQQFQNYLAQRASIYNMLSGQVGTGLQAAGQFSSAGQGTAANVGNLLTSGAAAGAAGTIGSTNALFGGLNTAVGAGSNIPLMMAMMNSGMFGGTQPISGGDFPGGSDFIG